MLETLLRPNDQNERCGLLLSGDRIVEIDNIAPEPTEGFEMDPSQALGHIMTGEVVATWHTHVNGEPSLSGEDRMGFLAWPDLVHYVISKQGVKKYKVDRGVVVECD